MTAVLQTPPRRRKAPLEGLSDGYGEIALLLAPLPTPSTQLSLRLPSSSSFMLGNQDSRHGSMHLASVFSSPPTMCMVSAASTQCQTSQTNSVLPSPVSRYEMIARLSGDECAFSKSGEGGARRRKKSSNSGRSKRAWILRQSFHIPTRPKEVTLCLFLWLPLRTSTALTPTHSRKRSRN